jgi:membrane-associated phospholipid phosphatase
MKTIIAKIFSNTFNAYFSLLAANILILVLDRELIPNYIFIIIFFIFASIIQSYLFLKFKLISDLDITDRRERPLFNLASLITSSIIIAIALTTKSNMFLSIAIINFVISLIMGVVSIFWKVSGHMTYLLILATITTMLFFSWPLFIFWAIIVPIVAWSRLELKKHTLMQVIGGTILGLLVTLILF